MMSPFNAAAKANLSMRLWTLTVVLLCELLLSGRQHVGGARLIAAQS